MSYNEDMHRAMVVMAKWAKRTPFGYRIEGVIDGRGSDEKRLRGIPWRTQHEAALRVLALPVEERARLAALPIPMKCSDIPNQPILDFLASHPERLCTWGKQRPNGAPSVAAAMPPSTPERLQVRKMARLIERGLVEGCGCGCRGDYRLPQKP